MKTMLSVALVLLLVAVAAGLSACATTNGGGSTTAVPAVAIGQLAANNQPGAVASDATVVPAVSKPADISVAGKWVGEWKGSVISGKVYLTLFQDGERVWGTYDWPTSLWGQPAINIGVDGRLHGSHLSLKAPSLAYAGFELEVTSNGMMEGRARGAKVASAGFLPVKLHRQ